MLRLKTPAMSDYLTNIYQASQNTNFADTRLVCSDGDLKLNRLVVHLMLRIPVTLFETDFETIIIIPDIKLAELKTIHERTFKNGLFIDFALDQPNKTSSSLFNSSVDFFDLEGKERISMSADIEDSNSSGNVKLDQKDSLLGCKLNKKENNWAKSEKKVYKNKPKNLKCPNCPYKTYHNSNLTNHKRIHSGEKPYSCKHCGEMFRFSGVRNLHEKTHTGEREYSCQYCGKEFARRYVCLLHERTHTGEKPFSCDFCGKRFTRHNTKTKHEENHINDQNGIEVNDKRGKEQE